MNHINSVFKDFGKRGKEEKERATSFVERLKDLSLFISLHLVFTCVWKSIDDTPRGNEKSLLHFTLLTFRVVFEKLYFLRLYRALEMVINGFDACRENIKQQNCGS